MPKKKCANTTKHQREASPENDKIIIDMVMLKKLAQSVYEIAKKKLPYLLLSPCRLLVIMDTKLYSLVKVAAVT